MRSQINYTLSNLSNFELNYFKSIFDYDEVRGSSFSKQELQEDGSTLSLSIDSHYMRVRNRWWDSSDIKELNEKVDKFNSFCRSCKMEIIDLFDEETEWDNDRRFPAYFQFQIVPKTK